MSEVAQETEFIEKEKMDPAKVLTLAVGKADSAKLLDDPTMKIRLTLDGSMFFNQYITKHILLLTPEEEGVWNAGKVFERSELKNDVYILKSQLTNHIIGSTIVKDGRILNFVPKWRRYPRPN